MSECLSFGFVHLVVYGLFDEFAILLRYMHWNDNYRCP